MLKVRYDDKGHTSAEEETQHRKFRYEGSRSAGQSESGREGFCTPAVGLCARCLKDVVMKPPVSDVASTADTQTRAPRVEFV